MKIAILILAPLLSGLGFAHGSFLRDVTQSAADAGFLASDANQVAPQESYVQLSDEEILAANPDLAEFFEMIEDDEKLAAWEVEKVPQLLLEIEASKRKASKKQKKWSRKAMVKSEIESCWVRNYWKDAAYWAKCRRWKKVWFVNVCTSHYCDSGDNMIFPLCHHGCNGWSDDGTRCWKKCSSQSTTPSACGHTMCTADTGACVKAVANMVVSIASMLASVFPPAKVAALAKSLVKVGTKAAMKALMKQFAKNIAKQLMKKTKRKVKKFMKGEVKGVTQYLKDEAVDAILEEAAEAFAIERTRQEMKKYNAPDFEEVARAIDPIGVMDVIDAFKMNSCDDTEVEEFPKCYYGSRAAYTQTDAMLWAEDECCFGYTLEYKRVFYWWSSYYRHVATCKTDSSHVTLDSSTQDSDDENGLDDNVDEEGAVDVLWEEQPVSVETFELCLFCAEHSSCKDNEVPGANLTLYNACTEASCCSETPDSEGFLSSSDMALIEGADKDETDCSACINYSMCASSESYEVCSNMGCCEGWDDPNVDDYVPPAFDESESVYHGGDLTDHPENTASTDDVFSMKFDV